MSSIVWAIFCSHDSVSATTCETWHLSGRVTYTGRAVPKSTSRVEATVGSGLANDGGVLGDGRNVLGRQCELRFISEGDGESLSGHLVAVASHARKGDLARDAVFKRSHAGRHRPRLRVRGLARTRDE